MIIQVSVVLNWTDVDSDWHFNNLCGSPRQSQSELYCQLCSDSVIVSFVSVQGWELITFSATYMDCNLFVFKSTTRDQLPYIILFNKVL